MDDKTRKQLRLEIATTLVADYEILNDEKELSASQRKAIEVAIFIADYMIAVNEQTPIRKNDNAKK